MKNLREQILKLQSDMNSLHASLSSVNAQNLTTLTNNQDESSHVVCFENDSSIKMSFTDEYIPQIDGDVASPPSKSIMQTEFQCVTFKKVFYSIEELDDHDSWIFCCELCQICFNTAIEADLHALVVHQENHFAHVNIPESTRLLHASGHT